MGIMEDAEYGTSSRTVEPGSRLFLYTDGAHEIHKKDGTEWTFEEFIEYLGKLSQSDEPVMDRLLEHVRELSGSQSLPDDFTMIEVKF